MHSFMTFPFKSENLKITFRIVDLLNGIHVQLSNLFAP